MSEQGCQVSKINQNSKQFQQNPPPKDEPDLLKARKPQRQPDAKAKKKRKLLSFQEEQQEEQVSPVPKIKKNANIKNDQGDKSLANNENLQEKLKEQFYIESERVKPKDIQLKEELIQLEFSYWEGANVVKKIRRKKKTKVIEFLEVCRLDLIQNFQNVASVEARDLLFVIKDFIAPHQMTLADIELLKLKTTKKDLLLNLRNVKFKKQEKELTLSVNLDGPVRIVERQKYERNKANYPFCNWHTLKLG